MRKFLSAAALCLALVAPAAAQTDAEQQAEAREILARSIAFQTTVSAAQTPQYAEYLRGLFLQAGFAESDTLIVPFRHTASLLVRYRGDGSGGKPILLLAHMDVVEARRAEWQRDPFTLVEENGMFFGRGSADNKSGVVTLTSTFLRLKREGFTPTRDLVLVFTGDEETAQLTVQQLIREHRDWLDADFALNSDGGGGALRESDGAPLVYAVQTAEKTYASYRLTARDEGGHSSAPRPTNPIYDIAAALERVRAHQFPVQWNDTTLASFRVFGAQRDDNVGAAMLRFAGRPGDRRAAETISSSPFDIGQIRTTCVPTLIEGGHAENALPQTAIATVNCRIFPGVAPASVQAQLQNLAGARVVVTPVDPPYASNASPLRDDVMAAVAKAVHTNYPGVPITPAMENGATDGLFFRAIGIPTYGVSEILMKASDSFSHGLNERIPVDAFYKGLTHWRVLIAELAGPR